MLLVQTFGGLRLKIYKFPKIPYTMEMQRDLSTHHQLISDLFPKIPAREAWDQYRLSDEQVTFFKENGYLSNIKMLEDWKDYFCFPI